MSDMRVDEVEIRLAFQEDTIEALNKIVAEQDKRIQRLEEGIRQLYKEVQEHRSQDDDIRPFDPANEVPPHY
ncbi:SlyX family protein [Oceanospirillum sediminis]|uniref:Protein SlyX homolog n=1 Tax=Oceanospirillum sediminis TaxID=2760088 RepID=A0A839IJN2_9GAMM|nr:SlyX family protein [Oceanospirillum sediminis]MBB1485111.1 SlyX family protein [Oceanospirillum sediminis]